MKVSELAKRKIEVVSVLLIVHVALVVYGAAGSPKFERMGFAGFLWELYGEMTAASHQYGFFAPRVGSPTRIRLKVERPAQPAENFVLSMRSPEGHMRLGGFEDDLRNSEEPHTRRDISASLAAAQFDFVPDARTVTVSVECMDIPEMDQARQGVKPRWIQISSCTFRRKP